MLPVKMRCTVAKAGKRSIIYEMWFKGSVVGVALRFGFRNPDEPTKFFLSPQPPIPALGTKKPPVQFVPEFFFESKSAGTWGSLSKLI